MKYAALLFTLMAGSLLAVDDSPASRATQADRYLQAASAKEMFADLANEMSKSMPPDQRAEFQALMTRHLNVTQLESDMKTAMVRHFTAEELQALADFYGSPVGKSAMKKMGGYMTELMPLIQAEVGRAVGRAQQEKQRAK
ncbi:MAG TPA: DUF2059 domain-containing protein [Opitutaceae bacterium]|nr:DUF2059 domain-containing protein [Opitutaceae bacterium]